MISPQFLVFQLRFQGNTVICNRPDVLRKSADPLLADHSALNPPSQQFRCQITRKNLGSIAQRLADVLAVAPRQAVTVLVNSNGTPWKNANVLAQAFAAELTRLKIEGMVFHGLRKTTAVVLAEAGCSTKQIAAITGQSDQMVEHYAKMADRERLAEAAVTKLERKLIRRPIKTDTDTPK